jgi:hypothetical protein
MGSDRRPHTVLAMLTAVALIGLVLAGASCDPQPSCPNPDRCPLRQAVYEPQVAANLLDLPPELRCHNYGNGSCCHCAIQDVLRWHGFHGTADWWHDNLSGAYSVDEGARELERLGFRYAYTVTGDEAFLEWCSRNHHGAAIHYYPSHAITFRGYQDGYAILQDNNHPDDVVRVPKATFIENWKGYGGRALSVVYSPYPPRPWI